LPLFSISRCPERGVNVHGSENGAIWLSNESRLALFCVATGLKLKHKCINIIRDCLVIARENIARENRTTSVIMVKSHNLAAHRINCKSFFLLLFFLPSQIDILKILTGSNRLTNALPYLKGFVIG
jgi:hypothetical protein